MNFEGLLVGLITFIIIGLFHPLVIKGYYYLGLKIAWVFLFCGIIAMLLSVITDSLVLSSVLGVTAFSSLWSIKETYEQRERVRKGWFPQNPNRLSRRND